MNYVDKADDIRKLTENEHDIAEIQRIINQYQQGYRIDRKQAEKIITDLNKKDISIALYNAPCRLGWVSFQDATDKQIIDNLRNTLVYLSGKQVADGVHQMLESD